MVAVFDQVNQEIEHLRLDRHALAAAGQFAKVDIKHMVGKMKLHGFIPVKTSQVISDRQVISGHCSSRRRLTGFPGEIVCEISQKPASH